MYAADWHRKKILTPNRFRAKIIFPSFALVKEKCGSIKGATSGKIDD